MIGRFERHKIVVNIMARAFLCCWCVLGGRTSMAATTIPGGDPGRPVALVGGTIHTMAEPNVVEGTLLWDQGKIVALNPTVTLPDNAETIDIRGLHVYPGLFQSQTDLGLIEISAVRATLDQAEVGRLNPNVKVQVAINPDSELIPVTRSNGVLLSLTAPHGPLIQGTSAVLQLDGWTWEDMTLRARAGLHVRWPVEVTSRPSTDDDDKKEPPGKKYFDEQMKTLVDAFAEARVYEASRDKYRDEGAADRQMVDLRWESLQPVLRGEIPLIVEADELVAIQQAVAFCVREKIKLVIVGGYDAPRCADLLKEFDVPIIVSAVYRLPRHRYDAYDDPYTLPERLRQSGVRFCIAGGGRFEASNSRNLPYHAATAEAYGLPHEEALRAITLYPAQILGVADRVGSLEVGKDATLIVTDGDPLDIPTHVTRAFIQGRPVDLEDRHKRLWQKYGPR